MTHATHALPRPRPLAKRVRLGAWGLTLLILASAAGSQGLAVTASQQATAHQVADQATLAGVALGDLAPNAPERHTVRAGDTLWDLAGLYLRTPWRWPELWGMNLQAVHNPHRIYPGQTLLLERRDGRALLRLAGSSGPTADTPSDLAVVRWTPQVRSSALPEPLSTLPPRAIEPFLSRTLVVQADELQSAARIVATQEHRVMLSRGDRAYARGPLQAPLHTATEAAGRLNVFRQTQALKDPETGELLGYEARQVGQAQLVRGETEQAETLAGQTRSVAVPAVLDIVSAEEDIQIGDRLLPLPEQQFQQYMPHAPTRPVSGRVIALHGNTVAHAAQNQVVVINRGQREGIERGHVLALLSEGGLRVDATEAQRSPLRLPDERNGLLLVFQVFDKLAYGLVLRTRDAVRVGDRLASAR